MTDAEAEQQADDLTAKIDDIIYDRTEGGGGSGVAADEIVRQLPELLYQEGWLTPDVRSRILDWMTRTGQVPDHHRNQGVWNSHLCELADILHSR